MWVLSVRNFCEEYNHKENEFEIDATEFYSEDRETILQNSKAVNINWADATIMDLLNMPYKSDIEIINLIKKELKIDINTPQWIDDINNLLSNSIELYQKRYLKKLPSRILKQKFKTTNAIIQFLKDTKKNKKTGILNCILAKIWLSANNVLNSEKVKRRNQLQLNFANDYIDKPFQIIDTKKDDYWNIYKKWTAVVFWENHERKIIDFEVVIRVKGPESIIWKNIWDYKYSSIEDFKDLIQVTYYTENEWDLIDLMKYNWDIVYGDEFEISDKDWIEKECFDKKTIADGSFKEKVLKAIKQTWEKKVTSSDDYKEVKQKWESKNRLESSPNASRYSVGTEIKYVIKWHDNEKWLSFHPIYDYQKRFRELTRLWSPIRKLDIINYVNDFFENIDKNLKVKKKEKIPYYNELFSDLARKWFIDWRIFNQFKNQKDFDQFIASSRWEEELAKWLYFYFQSKLIKVETRVWSKKYFYVSKEAINLQNAWLYPEEIQKTA